MKLFFVCPATVKLRRARKVNNFMVSSVVVVAFSSRERILRDCSTLHCPPALFFVLVEISSHKLIPLFWPGSVHSVSGSWDDRDRVFPDELHVSSFPNRFPYSACTAALSAHSECIFVDYWISTNINKFKYLLERDPSLLVNKFNCDFVLCVCVCVCCCCCF